MFLEKDERLLIMEIYPLKNYSSQFLTLSILDLLKVERVGVKTIHWDNFCFTDPDWEDRLNNILENTNLKILLPFWFYPPPGANWFLGGEINYADADVGKEIDEYTLKCLDLISYAKDRVQLTYAYASSGEFYWLKYEDWGAHEHQNEMVAEFVVERQKILSSQHDEVWMKPHDVMGGALHTSLVVNNALYAAFPDCKHYRVQHHYFPWINRLWVDAPLRRVPWAKYFVGSQWVAGLGTNYDRGMGHGAWGFLTSPVHTEARETRINDEMLAMIDLTIEKLSLEPDYSDAWEERPFLEGGPGHEV